MVRLQNTINPEMYFGASELIRERARMLRKKTTLSEKLFWSIVSKRQILDLHFRQQHPIHTYIVDFYCHRIKLAIEIDGSIHLNPDNKAYDDEREKVLSEFGITLVRFTNDQVQFEPHEVKKKLVCVCKNLLEAAPPTPQTA